MSRTPQRKNRFVPQVELLEDRWAPADLGMTTPTAAGTFWQTFEHDDMRTGASTVSSLIGAPGIGGLGTPPPALGWVAGTPFSGDGSPVNGSGAGGAVVVAPGVAGAQTNELSDSTGAVVGAFGTTTYGSQNAVTFNPVIDGSGNIYITNNSTSVMKIAPPLGTGWTTIRPAFTYGPDNLDADENVTTDPFVPNNSLMGPPCVYFGASSPDGNYGMIYAAADADGALTEATPVLMGRPIAISEDASGSTLYVRTTCQVFNEVAVEASFIYAFTIPSSTSGTTTLTAAWPNPAPAGGPFIEDGYGAITVDPTSTPTAGDLYYMTWDGYLAQADPSDGHQITRVFVGNQPYSNINLDSTAGIIYVSGGGTIQALNAGTLAQIWSFSTPGNALFTAPALAISTAGPSALYFVTTTGTLYSVNGATGAENWDVDLETLLGQPASAAVDSATIIDSMGNIIYNDANFGAVEIT